MCTWRDLLGKELEPPALYDLWAGPLRQGIAAFNVFSKIIFPDESFSDTYNFSAGEKFLTA